MSEQEEDVSLTTRGAPAAVSAKAEPKRRTDSSLKSSITADMSAGAVVDAIMSMPADQLIPWEDAELPSNGIYYGWPDGVVKVRAWGTDVDKILATTRLAQSGQSVNMLLKKCVKYPREFQTEDLLVGDQIFLLYYLRGITYGNIYEFIVTTPSKKKQSYKVDLNLLQNTIKWADKSLGEEPFRVSLPYLSEQTGRDVYVSVRFLRVKDQRIIEKTQSNWRQAMAEPRVQYGDDQIEDDPFEKSDELDDTVTQNLSRVIVDIMGSVTERHKIQQFVDKLHQSDVAAIRTWLRDNTPGLEPVVTLIDPSTGEGFKVALPITEAFFRRTDG